MRVLGCGSTGIEHLSKVELNFADRNNLLNLPIEDIKTTYSLYSKIGCTYKRLLEPLEIDGETNTVGAWCVYLGINYKALMESIKPKPIKGVWFSKQTSLGVCVYRRKTKKELDKEKGQRTSAIKLGITLEEYLNRYTRKSVIVKGQEVFYNNISELCKLCGVSEARVETRIRRKGMTLEDALQAPVERVGKYLYNDTVYSVKELCSVLGIKHRKFIDYKADYGDVFLDKLGISHLGIQPYVL